MYKNKLILLYLTVYFQIVVNINLLLTRILLIFIMNLLLWSILEKCAIILMYLLKNTFKEKHHNIHL